MVTHHIGNTDDAVATGHAHVTFHAVGLALVNRDEVLRPVHRVADHLGRNQLKAAQELQLLSLLHRRVGRQFAVETAQLGDLPFQIEVALRQFLVDTCQREELAHRRICLIDMSGNVVSRRKPHASLVAVVLEQQHNTDHLEYNEQQPVMIFSQESKQIPHFLFLISSRTRNGQHSSGRCLHREPHSGADPRLR